MLLSSETKTPHVLKNPICFERGVKTKHIFVQPLFFFPSPLPGLSISVGWGVQAERSRAQREERKAALHWDKVIDPLSIETFAKEQEELGKVVYTKKWMSIVQN